MYLRSLLNFYPDRVTIRDNVIHSANNSTVMRILDVGNVTIEDNSFIVDNNVTETVWITARTIDIHATLAGNSVATSPTSAESPLTPRIHETGGQTITVH